MKRNLRIFAVVVLAFTMISGCSTTGTTNTDTQDAIIKIVSQDVGYGVYRAVPDARPILAGVCAITDFTNPTLVAAQLKALIQQMTDKAKGLTDQDAQIAALTANNLLGLLDVQLANNADLVRAGAIVKLVVSNICVGVNLAAPK